MGALGDDLERMTAVFRGLSISKMKEKYGKSDLTCQQILDIYKIDRDERLADITWMESIP